MALSNEEAIAMINKALDSVVPNASKDISEGTHLVDDGILDSLDLVNFLFELETLNGGKIEAITETFEDFRVVTLVELLT